MNFFNDDIWAFNSAAIEASANDPKNRLDWATYSQKASQHELVMKAKHQLYLLMTKNIDRHEYIHLAKLQRTVDEIGFFLSK